MRLLGLSTNNNDVEDPALIEEELASKAAALLLLKIQRQAARWFDFSHSSHSGRTRSTKVCVS
jgi:hypothetical protein